MTKTNTKKIRAHSVTNANEGVKAKRWLSANGEKLFVDLGAVCCLPIRRSEVSKFEVAAAPNEEDGLFSLEKKDDAKMTTSCRET